MHKLNPGDTFELFDGTIGKVVNVHLKLDTIERTTTRDSPITVLGDAIVHLSRTPGFEASEYYTYKTKTEGWYIHRKSPSEAVIYSIVNEKLERRKTEWDAKAEDFVKSGFWVKISEEEALKIQKDIISRLDPSSTDTEPVSNWYAPAVANLADYWTVQDKVPCRAGLDRCRWIRKDGTMSDWFEVTRGDGRFNSDSYSLSHGYTDAYGSRLVVICQLKDFPKASDPLTEKKMKKIVLKEYAVWYEDDQSDIFIVRASQPHPNWSNHYDTEVRHEVTVPDV